MKFKKGEKVIEGVVSDIMTNERNKKEHFRYKIKEGEKWFILSTEGFPSNLKKIKLMFKRWTYDIIVPDKFKVKVGDKIKIITITKIKKEI